MRPVSPTAASSFSESFARHVHLASVTPTGLKLVVPFVNRLLGPNAVDPAGWIEVQ